MAYTKAQARKLAEQIHRRFGAKIAAATAGTPVPPEFVAGLIGVEAGKDRNGRISETATRFEPGVYNKLILVRAGNKKSWSGIRQADIKDASNEAVKNLATSFGLCQVMGWHTIHNLKCSIAELRDPEKHLNYAVQLLQLNSRDGDFERRAYVGEFREWNTGSESGKTYHADYVANATAVMNAYRELGSVETEPFAASLLTDSEPAKESSASEMTDVETVPAVPPLPVNVPGWLKRVVGWGAGLNLGSVGASFAVLRDNPGALMAMLNILKWGFVALGIMVGMVGVGVIAMRMWNAKLANDLNVARLRNFADPDTKNVDFSGWKAAPDKTEVKL